MKSSLTLMLLLIFFVGKEASGQNLLQPLNVGGTQLRAWGFTRFNAVDSSSSVSVNLLRFYSDLSNGAWYAKAEFGIVTAGDKGTKFRANWIHQLYIQRSFGEHWKVKVGRAFSSSLKVTNAPFVQETVRYESIWFNDYGLGVQIGGLFGDTFVEFNISARRDVNFSDSDQFKWFEYGIYASVPTGLGFNTVVSGQVSKKFRRAFVGYSFSKDKVHTRGGVYNTDEDGTLGDKTVAFSFVSYKPIPWLELHYRFQKSWFVINHDSETVATTGIRFLSTDENITLTVDYLGHGSGEGDALLARLQLRF